MVTIINYGLGNLGSIQNMLKRIGVKSMITSEIQPILDAEKLILPGVGSFAYAMTQLNQSGFTAALQQKVLVEKTPVLGICLGMQLFAQSSEEGGVMGLGWLDAETIRFKAEKSIQGLKIPHMGWNDTKSMKKSPLLENMGEISRFYYVHSYHIKCNDKNDILTETVYGYPFTSAVERGNIIGVQFHPEKSHKFGMSLLKNFVQKY